MEENDNEFDLNFIINENKTLFSDFQSRKLIQKFQNLEQETKSKTKSIEDRATLEQVLDQRTMQVLQKLHQSKFIIKLNGCVATGKEANVYHALLDKQMLLDSYVSPNELEMYQESSVPCAVKIFKTSILVFKKRQDQINGDHRFKYGYKNSSNHRKLIELWMDKEMRNLKRIREKAEDQIIVPTVYFCRQNIIFMQMIGNEEQCAPRVKDIAMNSHKSIKLSSKDENVIDDTLQIAKIKEINSIVFWKELFVKSFVYLYILHNKVNLVHADFSSYNLLQYEKHLVLIDVGQSVENDHPKQKTFLKRDINNVSSYYQSIIDELEDQDHLSKILYFLIINDVYQKNTEQFKLKNIDNQIEKIQNMILEKVNQFEIDEEVIALQEVDELLQNKAKSAKNNAKGGFVRNYKISDRQLNTLVRNLQNKSLLEIIKENYQDIARIHENNVKKYKGSEISEEYQYKLEDENDNEEEQVDESEQEEENQYQDAIQNYINNSDQDNHDDQEFHENLNESDRNNNIDPAQSDLESSVELLNTDQINTAEKMDKHKNDQLREMRENMDKKEWKKFVKEQNREKREHKIPKKVKEKYSKKKR